MSVQARVEALKQKHAALDEALHSEYIRPKPDDQAIAELKRSKLKVKEEISRLEIN
ncbi:YdcH family protein [Tistrella mobilis]|jgi:hypothetical protein|uniref:YdcH family protein n=1 Tax=Tistrella mobilis TaxID=171437 RepID=UPI003558539B